MSLPPPSPPAELQDRILRSLVAQRADDDKPAYDAAALAKQLQAGLGAILADEKNPAAINPRNHPPSDLLHWWRARARRGAVLVFSAGDADPRTCALVLEPPVVASLLSRGLGGKPMAPEASELTPFEMRFVERIAPRFAGALQAVSTLPAALPRVVAAHDASFVKTLADYPVLDFEYEIAWGDTTAMVAVAIATASLRLPEAKKKPSSKNAAAGRPAIAREIGRTHVSVEVVARLVDQTLARLQGLKPGDVIPATAAGFNEARVLVRGHEIFTGQIGRSGNNYSVRIARPTAPRRGGLRQMVSTLTDKGEQR